MSGRVYLAESEVIGGAIGFFLAGSVVAAILVYCAMRPVSRGKSQSHSFAYEQENIAFG